jgi:hypothetical protein
MARSAFDSPDPANIEVGSGQFTWRQRFDRLRCRTMLSKECDHLVIPLPGREVYRRKRFLVSTIDVCPALDKQICSLYRTTGSSIVERRVFVVTTRQVRIGATFEKYLNDLDLISPGRDLQRRSKSSDCIDVGTMLYQQSDNLYVSSLCCEIERTSGTLGIRVGAFIQQPFHLGQIALQRGVLKRFSAGNLKGCYAAHSQYHGARPSTEHSGLPD